MVDVKAAVDVLIATERRNPAIAREEQRGRKRCWNTDATELEESAAISPGSASRAEDTSMLVRSEFRAGQESANDPRPKSLQHVPRESADVRAAQVTAQSVTCAACGERKKMTEFRRGANTCTTCLQIACAACGKEKKQMAYSSQDVYNFLNRKINAVCQTCRRKGTKLRVSTHKTHKGEHCRQRQCTKCGVCQASSTFRRTKRGQRVDICRTCEVVPCAACGAMLTRENFTDPDIYRHFNSFGAKHITCLVCKKEQHMRQQRLQNLMKKSRRQACTCRHPQAHTQTCPLRIKFDGDRSYPGCDVMSRADSDWLMEQRKKNGWMRTE